MFYDGAEDSFRFLLTKNPARSFSCPWWQVHGISFERFPWPWQTVGPVSGPFILQTPVSFLVRGLTLDLSGAGGSTGIAPKITDTLKPYHNDNVGRDSVG